MRSKTLQIRLDEEEYHKVKLAFKGQNLSAVVRDFLLLQAEELLDSNDMSLQEDIELERFTKLLSHPEVQKTLYGVFKQVKEVK